MIKQAIKLKAGSSKPGIETAGTMSMAQAREIAEKKLPDLNAETVDAATKTVIGTARSMGVEVK